MGAPDTPTQVETWVEMAARMAAATREIEGHLAPAIASARLASPLEAYDAVVLDPDLIAATRKLFADQHYARAVEEAFKCLNATVKVRSGLVRGDGADLMFRAFDPDRPILRFNRLRSVTDRDEQTGLRYLMAGAMTGLRNPRAHDHRIEDAPQGALEMLVLASFLMRMLRRTARARRARGISSMSQADSCQTNSGRAALT